MNLPAEPREPPPPAGPTPAPAAVASLGDRLVASAVYIFFITLGIGLSHPFIVAGQRMVAARSWVETPCVVVCSQIGEGGAKGGYRPEISYSYTYDGQPHFSRRYSFTGEIFSSCRGGKETIVERYPQGGQTSCWVNPSRPCQSVLHRGFTMEMLVGVVPIALLVIGSWRMAMLWRARSRAGRDATPRVRVLAMIATCVLSIVIQASVLWLQAEHWRAGEIPWAFIVTAALPVALGIWMTVRTVMESAKLIRGSETIRADGEGR